MVVGGGVCGLECFVGVEVVVLRIGVTSVVGSRDWEAADGEAGHIDGTASNEFFGVALKAIEGDVHGVDGLGLKREEGDGGESESGEEREGAGHG